MPHATQQQGHSVIGDIVYAILWCVAHHDPALGRRRHIHVVVADAQPHDTTATPKLRDQGAVKGRCGRLDHHDFAVARCLKCRFGCCVQADAPSNAMGREVAGYRRGRRKQVGVVVDQRHVEIGHSVLASLAHLRIICASCISWTQIVV
jgi:hypothetical protein